MIMKQENVISTSPRNQSMDLLRILACLGVLIIHISGSFFAQNYVERGTNEWLCCAIINGLFKWPVPIFVIITGFFFLKPEKKLTLNKLYGKSLLRLVLSLVFWTWFYAITLHCRYTCFYPFGGQTNNFWYIGMCIGLYMSIPVLRIITADKKVLAYSCWIWLFINLYSYIGYYVDVPIVITDHVFVGYIGFCLWGYYLCTVDLNRRRTNTIYIIGLLSLIASVLLPFVTHGKVKVSFEGPTTVLTAIALFLFVIKHPVHLSLKCGKIVEHVSGMTFGIYMVHTFVILEIFTRLHRFVPNVYLLLPLTIVATFGLSYLIILVIKQIPVLKKWVV